MPKPITRLAGSWTYILASDLGLDPADQSVFKLAPLSLVERAAARDNVQRLAALPDGTQVTIDRKRQVALELCLTHVIEVQNFPPRAPEAWPAGEAERTRYIERLSDDDIFELGNEIYVRSTLGMPEKNSSPPGPTSSSGAPSAEVTSTTAPSAPGIPG